VLEFDPHVLDEKAVAPPPEFSKRAHVKSLAEYRALYERAANNPEVFWAEQAKLLHWFEQPLQILDWKPPHAKWFVGGKLNVSYNCVDRHLEEHANKPAILWEAEDGSTVRLTYSELHERVCRFANALKSLGVKPGDCVTIYMPMIPELPVAMLACARIGAVHSVIFGGFSATALIDRIGDSKSKILITADGGFRRGKTVLLKETADAALQHCPTIEKSIVVRRTGLKVGWKAATFGGTTSKRPHRKIAQRRRSIPSIRFTFSTPAARPESPRACCTHRPDICSSALGARD